MRANRKYVILLLIVVVAAVSAGLGFTANGNSASTWVFTNVTPDQLASQGVTVTPVATPAALATTATTAGAAAKAFTGNPTLVAPQYMHCVDTAHVPEINQDCWVVSTSTNGMYAPSAPWGGGSYSTYDGTITGTGGVATQGPKITWDITFVDPTSGQVIEGTLGN